MSNKPIIYTIRTTVTHTYDLELDPNEHIDDWDGTDESVKTFVKEDEDAVDTTIEFGDMDVSVEIVKKADIVDVNETDDQGPSVLGGQE